jgi:hypothetical protein
MSSTPRTDALIGEPPDVLFAHACQLERELAAALDAAAAVADKVWVESNSLCGSKTARRIADSIRDMKRAPQ